MREGSTIVKQVNIEGKIVDGRDQILTPTELFNVFQKNFFEVRHNKDYKKYIEAKYKGKNYLIRTKNVSYLGKTHDKSKKRYQIPDDLIEFYEYATKHNKEPLLIGIYHYDELVLFVNFGIDTYINKKANNSSAHVNVNDLRMAITVESELDEDEEVEKGVFSKVDFWGNTITIFDTNSVSYFFETLGEEELKNEFKNVIDKFKEKQKVQTIGREKKIEDKYEIQFDISRLYKPSGTNKVLPDRTRNIILNFFEKVNKNWEGKTAYNEMLMYNYRNKNQAEWPGFYLEFKFEEYLKKNKYENIIKYAQEKIDGGIDLDLHLFELNTYGDLKAHTQSRGDIPGNKTETIIDVLNKHDKVIYIVCEHDTIPDSVCNYEVTKYWNKNKTNRKKNQNLMSYKTRMKNSVSLKKVNILVIDSSNYQYLKGFAQGKNSNNKPRKKKIMIDGKKINKFLKLSYDL